jgi:protein-tyrosine phosphatase
MGLRPRQKRWKVRSLSDSVRVARPENVSWAQTSEATFSILAVCTGNVCRSPALERLLACQLGPTVSVQSAGTHALVGQPISEPMARLLRKNGIADGAFAARRLTESLIRDTDLVLALTRAQRSLAVELWPPAVRRTFTVREFARLLDELDLSVLSDVTPADRLRRAVPLAVAQRGLRATAQDDDVIDPFRLNEDVYAVSFAEITSAVNVIIQTLGT